MVGTTACLLDFKTNKMTLENALQQETTKTLFKKDSSNRIRFITFAASNGELHQFSGLLDTDSPVCNTRVCKGKNIGKANATTAQEQAEKELISKYTRKQDSGYFPTIEEAKNNVVLLPMLAESYEKKVKKIQWGSGDIYIQPKLDGMRCLAKVDKDRTVTLISRDGKNIIDTCNGSMSHIVDTLKKLPDHFLPVVLDGELYKKGDTFQEVMTKIKSPKSDSHEISLHVYDVVMTDKSFSYRKGVVSGLRLIYSQITAPIKVVQTISIDSPEEIPGHYGKYIAEGYEGAMIRHGLDHYKTSGRSVSLLKYKKFIDITAIIKDVIPSERRPTWGTPVLILPSDPTKTFKAGTKLSHAQREVLLTNKENYIGRSAEIRFFEYTDSGQPRFPTMVGIRLDK